MTISYLYNLTTGEIDGELSGPIYSEDIPQGSGVIAGSGPYDALYINVSDPDTDNHTVESKISIGHAINKTTITADNTDQIIISGVPTGTVMSCQGQEEAESSGALYFSTDLAGDYTLLLTHPLHLGTEIIITAT